jgi:hypothetical protein
MIYKKLNPLVEGIEEEYKKTNEYKTHKKTRKNN